MDPRNFYVRAGDLVLPAWNRLLEYLHGIQLRAGPGVLLRRTPAGILISAQREVTGYRGSFAVSLEGESVKVGRGYVNGLEPLIEKVPITGAEKKPQPALKLKEDRFDDSGRSWIAIVGKVDPETGKILAPETSAAGKTEGELELWIEQRNSRTDADDLLAIKPIAMLKRPAKEKKGFGTLHQIALFDYQHLSAKQNERWRHFFHPA